ncbi:MAG: hypothetical protein K8T91_04215 [Planctomycetes bacterium]|nr:hypothetical protein [Planctomycetota bacterium]
MKTLEQLQKEHPSLFNAAAEWVCEGWGVREDVSRFPSPEQLAAAMLMEARDQDGCVERGESDASFPKLLREVAFGILFAMHGARTISGD